MDCASAGDASVSVVAADADTRTHSTTLIAVPLLLLHNQFVERSIDDVFASVRVRWKDGYQAVFKAPQHVLPSPLVVAPRTSLIRLTCLDRAPLSR